MKANKFMQVFSVVIFILCGIGSYAQNVTVNKDGNYVAIPKTREYSKATGKTFTNEVGEIYPVYATRRGKLFYLKWNTRTSKEQRVYISPDTTTIINQKPNKYAD